MDESAISSQGYFVDDIQCVDCYLLLALNSMDEFVNGKFTPLVTCNGECAESSDILSSFVEVVFHQIASMDLASIQSLEHVKRNIREILNFCKGYGTFFASLCKNVFETLNQFSLSCKNIMVHLLNDLLCEFRDERLIGSLESMVKRNRLVKRGIVNFLSQAGDISGFIAMIEVLYHFHNQGMDLSLLLPEQMLKPFEIFDVNKDPSDDPFINTAIRHRKFCLIAKQLISNVFKKHSISHVYLVKKEKHGDLSPEEFNHSELILFYNNQIHSFQHFCYLILRHKYWIPS